MALPCRVSDVEQNIYKIYTTLYNIYIRGISRETAIYEGYVRAVSRWSGGPIGLRDVYVNSRLEVQYTRE